MELCPHQWANYDIARSCVRLMEMCLRQWANCEITSSSVRNSQSCALISGQIVKSRARLCATHGAVPSSVGKLLNRAFVCARLMEMCPHQWANCGIARSSVRNSWKCALISGQIVKSRVRLCATHGDVPSSVGKL